MKAKEIEGLNCEASAAEGIALVLSARLEEMCGLRGAALDRSEIKGVHDMRVASRRLRSALRDFKPYLRWRKLKSAAAELKSVADALGSVRDEDVAIKALDKLQEKAPAEVTAGITALTDERRSVRDAARTALVEAITVERLDELRADFADDLKRAVKPRRRQRKDSADTLSFRAMGREIILARLAELQDLSAALYEPFETDGLHRMRIAAKRLRYAMELFAACWGERLTKEAEEVSELQTSLGELHDGDVWIEAFGHRLRSSQAQVNDDEQEEDEADAQKRCAAIWLMGHFAKARTKHYRQALARWHGWETGSFFADLIATLDAPPPSIELSPTTLTPTEAVASDIEAHNPT